MIYFDNAASTPLSPKVKTTIINLLNDFYANPSSVHRLGEKNKKLLDESRRKFAEFFDVSPKQVIFTSGATESNNLALKGYLASTSKKEIITTPIEHSSILETLKQLEKEGLTVRYVELDDNGMVDIDSLKSLINDNTALICVGVVNNETGIIQDYKTISEIARNHSIPFFSDSAQALGHIDLDWSYFDFITISAHKIHGPKGVGALILINPNIKLVSQMNGGGQENGYRSGTENVIGIYTFATALSEIDYSNNLKVLELKKNIISMLDKNNIQYLLNGDIDLCSPYILNISIIDYDSDTLIRSFGMNEVFLSSTSACLYNLDNYSYVINTIYKSTIRTKSAIRLSFSKYNTLSECETFVSVLLSILKTIKGEDYERH